MGIFNTCVIAFSLAATCLAILDVCRKQGQIEVVSGRLKGPDEAEWREMTADEIAAMDIKVKRA